MLLTGAVLAAGFWPAGALRLSPDDSSDYSFGIDGVAGERSSHIRVHGDGSYGDAPRAQKLTPAQTRSLFESLRKANPRPGGRNHRPGSWATLIVNLQGKTLMVEGPEAYKVQTGLFQVGIFPQRPPARTTHRGLIALRPFSGR